MPGSRYDPAEYWSEVAQHVGARVDDRFLAGPEGAHQRAKRELALFELGRLEVAGRTVLELGPGPGGNLLQLATRDARRLIGAEIAPGMVRLARANLGQRAQILQLAGTDLPLNDHEVDVTFTVTVLQHNPDIEALRRLAAELARVTKDQLLIIEDITLGAKIAPVESYVIRPLTEYETLFTSLGFDLVEVKHLHLRTTEVGANALHRVVDRLSGRATGEGHRIGRVEHAVERLMTQGLRKIDMRRPPSRGLSALWFKRHGS